MESHPEALLVIQTLKDAGYVAYYAGGWVRDFLLNLPSDDIDIATDAPIDIVQKLFEKTVPIGVQFGIVLVLVGNKQYEVATFRKDLEYSDGRRPSKIEFTSAEEDAKRRDFTINGMFYDPLEKKVIDYVDGQKDLDRQIIEAIGNAHERIQEDRLRMIRAIRLACRFNFAIEEKTEKAIRAHIKELFPAVAIERIWQEFKKMGAYQKLKASFLMLFDYGLLQEIFPKLEKISRKALEEKLAHVDKFPDTVPLIGAVLQLFDRTSLEDWIHLCRSLKLSNQDIKFVTFLFESYPILEVPESANPYDWAHFYANELAQNSLFVFAAHLSPKAQESFLKKHEERKLHLRSAVFRIENKTPVVSSEHLIKEGIKPGKQMGALLNEAEKIAINQNIDDPKIVLKKLKTIDIWPL